MHALVRFAHVAAGNNFTTVEIHAHVIKALGYSPDRYTLASLRSPQAASQGARRQAPEFPPLSTSAAGILDLPRLPEAIRAGLCPADRRPS
jgi:hypothetical protein